MRNSRNDSVVPSANDRGVVWGTMARPLLSMAGLGTRRSASRSRLVVAGYMLDAAGQVAPAARPRQADGILLMIPVRGSMVSSTIGDARRSIEPKKSRPALGPQACEPENRRILGCREESLRFASADRRTGKEV